MKLASHSKWPTARPLAAPVPARPTRCSLPIFEANRLAPTASQPTSRLARKKSALTFFSRFAAHQAIAARRRKYPPITMMSTTLRLLMAFGPWLRVDVRALKHCPAALLPRFLRSPGFETAKNLRIFAPGRYDSR